MSGRLGGRCVVVTRDEPANGPLTRALRAHGASVTVLPCVRIAPPEDPTPLEQALERLAGYDWILVTSANAVAACAALDPWPPDPATGSGAPRFLAVGDATAAALRGRGVEPTLVGSAGVEALVATLASREVLSGARILFPASERAGSDGIAALRAAGADVTQVIAYRTLEREGASAELRRLVEEGAADAVTFTSPSAAQALGPAFPTPTQLAAIGTTTAQTLCEAGWRDVLVPARPDLNALAATLAAAFESRKD